MLCCRCGSEISVKIEFCSGCGAAMRYPCVNGGGESGTSTGMNRNTAALLTYLAGWLTGLIFFFIESNRFVRFHALQSMIAFGSITVLHLLIWLIRGILWTTFLRTGGSYAIWNLLGAMSALLWIATLVLWVILMVKANQGETFKLPLAGELAEKHR